MTSAPPKLFEPRALEPPARPRGALAREKRRRGFLLRAQLRNWADRLAVVQREFAGRADIGTPTADAALVSRAAPAGVSAGADSRSLGEGEFLGLVGDAERSPFRADRFDLVASLLALHHVDDLPGALIQMRETLRPDGCCWSRLSAAIR